MTCEEAKCPLLDGFLWHNPGCDKAADFDKKGKNMNLPEDGPEDGPEEFEDSYGTAVDNAYDDLKAEEPRPYWGDRSELYQ